MRIHAQTIVNRIGKALARPLSHLVANPVTQDFSRLAEAYLAILLGKGAGTNWSLDAEVKAAVSTIQTFQPVILDVGANMGEWSVSFHQFYPQAQIFQFEPQPECVKILSARGIPGVTLIPYAVSATAGDTVRLFTSGDAYGIASLHQRRDSYFCERDFTAVEVETVTIDGVVLKYNIPRIDFMKMDVEGHELDVLKGARNSLERRLIRALSFEFGSANVNSRTYFHDFWDLLTPLGYRIYRVLPSGRLMPIKEYYEDCEHFRGVTNYLAF